MAGTAVVIGAGGGIGEAVARRVAAEPWVDALVVADLQGEPVEKLAIELGTRWDVTAHVVDVTDPASIRRLVDDTPSVNRVAIVSGVFHATSSLEADPADFERILRVNLIGPFLVAQAYARVMLDAGEGAIVGVASIAARMPRMRQAAYAASKAGMRQALRVLAMETVPRGVRINTVSPGPTDTPMMRELARDHPDADLAAGKPEAFRPPIPRGRVGRPEEIASAVAFLLSPEASHIAMQDLLVDGGETLGL